MSFNIETVAARLVPFDLGKGQAASSGNSLENTNFVTSSTNTGAVDNIPVPKPRPDPNNPNGLSMTESFGWTVYDMPSTESSNPPVPKPRPQIEGKTLTQVGSGTKTYQSLISKAPAGVVPKQQIVQGDPLAPITATGGLVFPYTPTISEGVNIKYDSMDLIHSNESPYTYRGTENTRITLGECIWTCDTFEKARYALAVLHFLRSYALMDFGKAGSGRKGGSGRPPSPMWFSAYGSFVYKEVPVLMERAEWSFPQEGDYVGIPNPGTSDAASSQLNFQYGNIGQIASKATEYSWMPMVFKVSSISLIVQHSIKYWTSEFSLEDFKNGKMVTKGKENSGTAGFIHGPIVGPGGRLGGGT